MSLTLEQQEVHDRLLSYVLNQHSEPNQEIHFIAPGGYGKSFVLRAVIRSLELHGKHCAVLAFTGRAVSHLAKDAGIPAQTCHSLLYDPILDENGDLIEWKAKPRSQIKQDCGNVIIVDESSMIPRDIDNILKETGVPIIYTGDDKQLPSVSRDSFCVFDRHNVEKLTLTENMRIKKGMDGLVNLTEHLREDPNMPRRKGEGLSMIRKSSVMNVDFHRDNKFDMIICGMNKTRKKINGLVRSARGFFDEDAEIGEQVVCLKNTVINEIKIYNGELFEVLSIFQKNGYKLYILKSMDTDNKTVNVNISDGTFATEESNPIHKDLGTVPFAFGYCLTSHKGQGSTFDTVLFIDEDVSFFLDQQRFRYTSTTRAASHLTVTI